MILNRELYFHSNAPHSGVIANNIMSDHSDNDITQDEPSNAPSMKDQWTGDGYKGYMEAELNAPESEHVGPRSGEDANLPLYFKPSEFNLYVGKDPIKCYIFHGRDLPVMIERFELKDSDSRINVFTTDGQIFDLGMKLGWLMRPYFKQTNKVYIVQTRDGEAIEGHEIPLIFKT